MTGARLYGWSVAGKTRGGCAPRRMPETWTSLTTDPGGMEAR